MTVNAVIATPTGIFGDPIGGATDTTSSTKPSDKDTFMQLLVAQLRYQNPSNPTDPSAFLSQSAQFSSLEKMQTLADATNQMLTASMAFGASSLVGRSVSWTDASGVTASGTVDGVTFGSKGPVLSVGSGSVPMNEVTSVRAAPSAPSAPSTPSTTGA
ncbi:MAG: flagellar hook capping protein [Actinomycetota bacterium]|nr:flagellar hook capping protein [Actinomycetota bacterium]